jgi:hypothetical protein
MHAMICDSVVVDHPCDVQLCKSCGAADLKGRGVLGHCTPPLSSSPGNQAANAANDEGNILAGRARRGLCRRRRARRRAVRAADRRHAVPEQHVRAAARTGAAASARGTAARAARVARAPPTGSAAT